MPASTARLHRQTSHNSLSFWITKKNDLTATRSTALFAPKITGLQTPSHNSLAHANVWPLFFYIHASKLEGRALLLPLLLPQRGTVFPLIHPKAASRTFPRFLSRALRSAWMLASRLMRAGCAHRNSCAAAASPVSPCSSDTRQRSNCERVSPNGPAARGVKEEGIRPDSALGSRSRSDSHQVLHNPPIVSRGIHPNVVCHGCVVLKQISALQTQGPCTQHVQPTNHISQLTLLLSL